MLTKTNPKEISDYLEDTSNIKGKALAIYFPNNKEELIAIIKECTNKNTPITVLAGRTGTTGGCVPFEGVSVSLENLNKIIDINVKEKIAYLESGVTLAQLDKEANKYNLSLKASPTESLACLGGAISTCASGVRGFGYGSIRNYIVELEVILTSGDVLKISRGEIFSNKNIFDFTFSGKKYNFKLPDYQSLKVKSQAGYFVRDNMDLIDLFIGSEGTLGVVVTCKVALSQIAFKVFDGLIFFNREQDSLNFVNKVKELKDKNYFKPTSLEFLDKNSLALLGQEYSFLPQASAAVYFEQEADSEQDFESLMNKWLSLLGEFNASLDDSIIGDTKAQRQKIFDIRHKLPQLINEFLRQNKQLKTATDIAVPWDKFSEMYDFYKQIAQDCKISYVNFGHIGEEHLHFNFLPCSDSEGQKARELLKVLCQKAVSLGGTISAEHGIGKIKKPYLKIMYNQKQISQMAMVKKYFDSHCILGLDNIFEKELLY